MYKRHNIWDEDKWDMHNSGSHNTGSGYSGSSNSTGAGYTKNGKNPFEHYHKSEIYSSNNPSPEKIKDTIVDAVEHEEKYKKKENSGFLGENPKAPDKTPLHHETKEYSRSKKETATIEDAIRDAIKEEKKIIHLG